MNAKGPQGVVDGGSAGDTTQALTMKKTIIEQVCSLVQSVLEGTALELVEVEFHRAGKRHRLVVTIDKPGGVGIQDCQWVSERLSPLLDIEDPIPGSYVLEVSSPGLERPLRTAADYERFAGRRVRIRLNTVYHGRKSWSGLLTGYREGLIFLAVDTGEELQIPLAEVSGGNLEFEFP